MRKRRFQKGSLQQVRRGKAKRWVVLYYNAEGKRQYHTLPGAGSMTKTQAEKERDEFMRTINGSAEPDTRGLRPVLLGEFVEQKFLPFQRKKWKASTAGTSENRIRHHIVKGIGGNGMREFSLTSLQAFLEQKADEGLSFSVVDHLRWDLSAIFEMAIAEKVIETNPATRLYTPKHAPKGQTRAMSVEQVNTALAAVDFREQVLLHMAIFSGFRPGEMLGLQRCHVAADGSAVNVVQRVYRGIIDDPKTHPSRRKVAIPPRTAELLREWMESAVGPEPSAYVFAGEKRKPVWRDTLLYDHIRPKLKSHGLECRNFALALPTGIPRRGKSVSGIGSGLLRRFAAPGKVRRWPQRDRRAEQQCERQKEGADIYGPEVAFRLWGFLVPENQARGSGVAISIRTHVIGGPPRWRADDNGGPVWSDTV